jgi:hypothetical protein
MLVGTKEHKRWLTLFKHRVIKIRMFGFAPVMEHAGAFRLLRQGNWFGLIAQVVRAHA